MLLPHVKKKRNKYVGIFYEEYWHIILLRGVIILIEVAKNLLWFIQTDILSFIRFKASLLLK